MKHKVIQNNLVLHHGEKNNSSNPFSYQENPSRQRAQRFKTLVSGSKQPWRSSTFLNKYIILQKRIRLVGSLALVFLLTLTAFTLRPVSVSTDFAEATVNPATTTLTMTTGYASASLDITPSSTTGTFASSSDDELAKFTVSTNNITGYNLSISHGSSTTPAPLTNEDLSEDLDSLPAGTSITDSEFNTSTYVGYYGYKPSKLNSVLNSNYIPAPTTSSTTINQTQCANNTASCNTASDDYTIALGANIDYTKSAGTYTNTFILTAVANNVAYTINYLDNTGTGGTTGTDVSNLPAAESASEATASSFTLSSTQPTRTGYTFAGWCDGTVTHNATGNDTCSGTTYSAGSAYSFASPSSTSTNVANLYAMWKADTHSLAITFAGTGVSSVKVCKAAGDCSGDNLMGTVSSSGSSVSGLTYGVAYYLYPTYSTGYTLNSWSKTDSAAGSVLSSTTASNPTYKIGDGNGAVTITGKLQTYSLAITFANNTGVSSVKVCKTAGDCSGTNLMGTVSTSGNSVSGLTYNTAYYLYPTFSSGYTFSSWTKTSFTGTLSSTTTANPTFTMGAGNGAVTITGKTDKLYIQDFTASMCSTQASSSAVTVYDRRDEQAYTVRYINGNCWMTRNLAIGCNGSGSTYGSSASSKTLTSTYSNVISSWSTPTAGLSNGDSYTVAYMTCSSSYGAWYNYKAATAGTITGSSNRTNATMDICPAGWRLPTYSEQSGITSYSSAFSPVTGGRYSGGSLGGTGGYGYWWSATAGNYTTRGVLGWNGSSLNTNGADRNFGFYVRCVRSS